MNTTAQAPRPWVPDTTNLQLMTYQLNVALAENGIGAVDGAVGLGKTSSVRRWAHATGRPVLYLPLDDTAHASQVDTELLELIGIEPDRTRWKAKLQIRSALDTQPYIVITDEAGTAPAGTLRRLRTHHDASSNWTWVLVGRGTHDKLAGNGDLRSRAKTHMFEPMDDDELLTYLRSYHPALYANADARLLLDTEGWLAQIDTGPRNLRAWKDLTTYALARAPHAPTLTPDLATLCLADCDKRPLEQRHQDQ